MSEQQPSAAPTLSYESPLQEVRGPELRRSLFLITLAWTFGSVWMYGVAGTPLANFATTLKASKFQIGLMSALPFLGSFVVMIGTLISEATGQRKRVFLWGIYIHRLLWIPIGLIPLWLVSPWGFGMDAHAPAMSVFLMLLFFMYAMGNIGAPAWTSWMADIVPDRARGRYFARRRQWGIASGIPAAFLVGWLLDRYGGGNGSFQMLACCDAVFCVCALFGTADGACFHWVPDIPVEPQKGLSVFKAWREPLRNRRFLWFAGFVATLVFAVCFMGQFATLYIMEQLGLIGDGARKTSGGNLITQLMLIVVPNLAMLLVVPIWGRAADRMGKRPLLILAGLGLVPVAIGWCFVTRSTVWLGYVLAALGGALWVGVEVANLNLVLEMSGSDDDGNSNGRSGYVAINAVIVNSAGCLGGLAAGLIAEWLGEGPNALHWVTPLKTFTFYDVLFLLSDALRLLSVVIFLPHVKEPESRPTRDALRFMTANIYNNLYTAAMLPLRMMGLKKRETYLENEPDVANER